MPNQYWIVSYNGHVVGENECQKPTIVPLYVKDECWEKLGEMILDPIQYPIFHSSYSLHMVTLGFPNTNECKMHVKMWMSALRCDCGMGKAWDEGWIRSCNFPCWLHVLLHKHIRHQWVGSHTVNREARFASSSLMYSFTTSTTVESLPDTTALFVWLGLHGTRVTSGSAHYQHEHMFSRFSQCCVGSRRVGNISLVLPTTTNIFLRNGNKFPRETRKKPNALHNLHMFVMLFAASSFTSSHSRSRVKSKQNQLARLPLAIVKNRRENFSDFSFYRSFFVFRWFSNFSRLLEIQQNGCG